MFTDTLLVATDVETGDILVALALDEMNDLDVNEWCALHTPGFDLELHAVKNNDALDAERS